MDKLNANLIVLHTCCVLHPQEIGRNFKETWVSKSGLDFRDCAFKSDKQINGEEKTTGVTGVPFEKFLISLFTKHQRACSRIERN